MAGRLSLVQGREAHGLPRLDSRPRSSRYGAQRLSSTEQSSAFSQGLAARSRELRRWFQCLDRRLRDARDLEAALLQRRDARSDRKDESLDRIEFSPGTREALGATPSRRLD